MNRRTLKIIALVTMTIDHIGMILFPYNTFLRIIGRISFPVFSYFVAESMRYTSNRIKYISLMAVCEAVCLMGYYIQMGYLYYSIMMTFIFSAVIIMVYDLFLKTMKKGTLPSVIGGVGFMIFLYGINELCRIMDIMYGFWGCMLPLLVYMRDDKFSGLLFFALGLYLQSRTSSSIQIYSLLSIPLLALYDGKKMRSTKFEKYFYYFYYPIHIAFLYLLGMIL